MLFCSDAAASAGGAPSAQRSRSLWPGGRTVLSARQVAGARAPAPAPARGEGGRPRQQCQLRRARPSPRQHRRPGSLSLKK